jgi:hypothetical protein
VLLVEEDKDWSLLHDLTPTATLLLGFVDHARLLLAPGIHLACMSLPPSSLPTMSAVLTVHRERQAAALSSAQLIMESLAVAVKVLVIFHYTWNGRACQSFSL